MAEKKKKKTKSRQKKGKYRFLIGDKKAPEQAKWYVVHTYSGHEYKVVNALRQRVATMGLKDKVFEAIIPLRSKFIIKKGEKVKTREKVFPGYVLVRMILNDNSWIVVKTTPGVTGFIGSGDKPLPISQEEVDKIVQTVEKDKPRFQAKFSVGEAVKITDGAFVDSLGTIEEIDEKRGKLKVLVSIFGREVPVELDFLQVAKI
jgi:transcriptional antiterminator NusG